MKFYSLDTKFTFGVYEGKTMKEILAHQPSYLNWCAINLDHFYISEEIIAEIKIIKPDFKITEEEKKNLLTNIQLGKTKSKNTIMTNMLITICKNLTENMKARTLKNV